MASARKKKIEHKTVKQRYPEMKRSIGTNSSRPRINASMEDVMKVWNENLPTDAPFTHGGKQDTLGTMLPYMFSMLGDLVINPSTVSPSTYKKMVDTDYAIQVSLKYIIDFTINKIKRYTHPDPVFQKHIRRCIEKNKRGFKTMLRDMATALVYGHSESEMEWAWDEELGCDVVVYTYPLPQMTTVMRVTSRGNLQEAGIGQYVFNGSTSAQNGVFGMGYGGIGPMSDIDPYAPMGGNYGCGDMYGMDPMAHMGDMDYAYRSNTISPVGLVWIPTDKVIRMVNYGVTSGGNPYGYGLRHIYPIWVKQEAVSQFMLKAIRSKSSPLVVFFADPNVPVGDFEPNDPNVYGGTGEYATQPNTRTYADMIREELQYRDSTSELVLSGLPGQMADVKSIANDADINIMMDVLRYFDEMKMAGLFVPRTIFGGGGEGRGSHSLSKTHSDVTSSFAESFREDLIIVSIEQYIRPQIEEYFTEEEIAANDYYYGSFESDTITIDDQLKLMQMVKLATDTGFVSSKELPDLNLIRKMIDFEKMDKNIKVFTTDKPEKSMGTRKTKDATGTPYAHAGG